MTERIDYFRSLFDYTYWARDRLLATAAHLRDAEFLAPQGLDHVTIGRTFAHMLATEILMRRGLQTSQMDESQFSRLATISAQWQIEEGEMRSDLSHFTDSELDREVSYVSGLGISQSEPLWQVLLQVVNHQTEHRSEIAMVLTRLGHSPGFLDYIGFVRETKGPA